MARKPLPPPLPGRQFRNRVLELPSRFANHELDVLRRVQHHEMRREQIAKASSVIQGSPPLRKPPSQFSFFVNSSSQV